MRRLVLVLAVLCVASCKKNSCTTTEPAAGIIVAGTYNGAFRNSCGASGSAGVVVDQSGSDFRGVLPGAGTISGTMDGPYVNFTLTFAAPCSGTATGSASVTGTSISGAYSGAATGAGCCNPVTGSFALTR